jgi:phage minor structural protein
MYKAFVDGKLLFDAALDDETHIIFSPRLDMDIDGAGSFSFVIPPVHALYDGIRKLKSIITVQMDDEIIFRGRAVDDERDTYNQKNVYCEGDRSFLLDSVAKPYSYTGNVQEFFHQLISSHNAQVDVEKRFTPGRITAVSDILTMEAEDDDYSDTWARMEDRLLGAYGGYIRTRTEGGVTYLDWMSRDGDAGEQAVEFGVNLLDLTDKLDASQVFTCLIPLGESAVDENGDTLPPVSIASVNDGVEYIQDDEAVEMYGKIWRTQTWDYVNDPAELLEKAKSYMKTGISVQTLTLQFIDMHFTEASRKRVFVGDHPRILSQPHGMNISPICVKASLDLYNPEKSTYTFGEAPKTLTENFIQADEDIESVTGRRGGGGSKKNIEGKLRWAIIEANDNTAQINLLTHDQNLLTNRISNAEIRLDGIDATILLKADRELVNELETRVTSAEIAIDGANASIALKADATIVDALGSRVSSAEVTIDGMNAEIGLKVSKNGVISAINLSSESATIKASKINLEGYVTASQLSALEAKFDNLTSGVTQAALINTQNLMCNGPVTLRGHSCDWSSLRVCTNVHYSKEANTIPATDGLYYYVITSVKVWGDYETINFMSY